MGVQRGIIRKWRSMKPTCSCSGVMTSGQACAGPKTSCDGSRRRTPNCRSEREGGPQQNRCAVRRVVFTGRRGRCICVRVGPFLDGARGHFVQRRAVAGMLVGRCADGLVGKQVGAGAGAARSVVFGCGDQKLARRVERVRVPAGREHALPPECATTDVVGIFRRRDAIIRLLLFWPSTTTNGPNHAGTWAEILAACRKG